MQDGTQVVGKVPNPNAGRPHYTTASEVATMDFARNGLGTPVPKVLAWSSKAKENPVGAEYIIMEKVSGVQLDKVWQKMSIKDRFEIVKTISRYQKAWTSTAFAQYGSLYYSSDLDISNGCVLVNEDGSEVNDCRFAVGPSTGREFLDDGRIALDFDRGPLQNSTSWQLVFERLPVYETWPNYLDLEKEWSSLPGVQAAGNPPFPLCFSVDEADLIDEDATGAIRGMELMQSLRQSLGELWPEKGVVRPDQYDEVKKLLKQAKTELIDRLTHSETERVHGKNHGHLMTDLVNKCSCFGFPHFHQSTVFLEHL